MNARAYGPLVVLLDESLDHVVKDYIGCFSLLSDGQGLSSLRHGRQAPA